MKVPEQTRFANMIRKRRKELGLRLDEVADATRIPITVVSKLERATKQERVLNRAAIDRLAAVLKLDAEALRDAHDEVSPPVDNRCLHPHLWPLDNGGYKCLICGRIWISSQIEALIRAAAYIEAPGGAAEELRQQAEIERLRCVVSAAHVMVGVALGTGKVRGDDSTIEALFNALKAVAPADEPALDRQE